VRREALVRRADEVRGVRGLSPIELRELSELYRSLAGDLMTVRRDRLGVDLERNLDLLAARAHNVLYAGTGVGAGGRADALSLLLDFPGAVRRNARLVLVAMALFYVPLFATWALAYADVTWAEVFMSPAQLEHMEDMYRQADPSERTADTDAGMTGFYVFNNIGIAFRCFATGLGFGVGPVFFSVYNGIHIGTVFGHLARVDLGPKVLSAAAGLQMGLALVRPGRRTRIGALEAHGLELVRQVFGITAFLALAALLEGNVSPSELPVEAKYALGVFGWIAVHAILLFAGRRRPVPADARALAPPPPPTTREDPA
jgi:uncharacterized membrane protein SpoIIM required for sporulation